LRSGFICAGKEIIEKLSLYRTYHGVTLSFPTQKASAWAWSDRKHVIENRIEYDRKYTTAISCLETIDNLSRPPGGFYLWLKLPCDDEIFAKTLYQNEAILSLPGSYLAKENNGVNPGKGYLRLAVVHDLETVSKAFTAVNKTLKEF
jgi:N-succinyldiaminopimelate aminotransferase